MVSGGGVALIRALAAVGKLKGANEDQNHGLVIALRAMVAPLREIVINCGEHLGELMAKFEATQQAGNDDPETDPTWRRITRIQGKLVSRNPASGAQAKWINEAHAENVGAPMHVVTADGRNLLVYANAHTEGLMTSRLLEGQTYVFIAREASLSQNPEDTLSFDALSYDKVGP